MPQVPTRTRVSVVLASTISTIAIVAGIVAVGVVVPGSPMVTPTSAAETEVPSDGALTEPLDPETASTATDSVAAEESTSGDVSQIRNVVLLLADDLDWPLFDGVPRLSEFMDQGTTLTNFVVTESLCCPSRSSIMRGQYVHNHKVISNIPQTGGGWQTFYDLGRQKDCLPVWLSEAGITTSHFGKYLNGFPSRKQKPTYTPPGWANFVSTTRGKVAYTGYNYTLNTNGTLQKYGDQPTDFLEDVLTAKTNEWLETATDPFYLEFSSYLPHSPAPAAPRFTGTRAGSQAPRLPNYNAFGIYEPAWLKSQPKLGPKQQSNLDLLWTRRLESAESMADSFHAIMAQLETTGHLDDTLVIITSDNGYHVGSHRIPSGKHTPYREDSVVPAIFIGPGIAKGVTIDAMTSTIDLAPTIAAIQGAATPTWLDGRNLMPLLLDPENAPWRTGVLTENMAPTTPDDPDYSGFEAPKYDAVRTQDYLYVDYGRKQGAALYNLQTDPYEIHNVIRSTDQTIVRQLAAQAKALARCSGESCRVADSMPNTGDAVPAS
ncbi:MAG: sulfatase [Candidatus Nanopelagicales bacterium]|nr:sulfatase [Candidatus Nanopelagicales bacterium]MCF8537522.1 sulfatase [Candidatus Nanopelagicales bacterium]MCF8542300.1 sulfatase [Candidatus Nanopelagicales bacterium]MCF8555976.1 sulfatase [Candidatus Nanopelagicales bacterium]